MTTTPLSGSEGVLRRKARQIRWQSRERGSRRVRFSLPGERAHTDPGQVNVRVLGGLPREERATGTCVWFLASKTRQSVFRI